MKNLMLAMAAAAAILIAPQGAGAIGWPSNYQGVMLQGFYWDSYDDTKWTVLEQKADEYAEYFSLIWVPNSAKSMGSPSMGYSPIYWFTQHNSSFGTEKQLRSMIQAYKDRGVGIIEDVVVNHRAGVSNWYDFPAETYKGKTYKLTNGSICSTDEVWSAGVGCPASYRGNPDTGDDFNGCRDLDHTNATVQEHIKEYCKFLLDDLGYTGFRLDMVKGYAGRYTKLYNQYAKPRFSVGEFWSDSYDEVAAWIEATGRESAAFDFPFKYAVNSAFSSGDMTRLSWKANGVTDQPAGLIHYGYPQLAVTFIDNHDTYRDGSKFTGNIPAANAFMLCSPGTPCVFLPHYQAYKAQIQALIKVRNDVGVHNQSAVRVLQLTRDCYMAEVTGTKGKLVVKIGSAMVSPQRYSDSQIKCSGKDYCVWATTDGGSFGDFDSYPATLYLMGHTNGYEWSTSKGVAAKGSEGVYRWYDVTIDNADSGYGYFAFATKLGPTWDAVNASDRYGASSADKLITKGSTDIIVKSTGGADAASSKSWKIASGTYDITATLSTGKLTVTAPSAVEAPAVDDADAVYYNLQGVRVENPGPGLYIRVNAGKTEKVMY